MLARTCGGTHAVTCPEIEIELKTGITTPFSGPGQKLAISGNGETDAFWDAGSVVGECGGTTLVKLPITPGFPSSDRKKTYTLKVTGNDNSYDQIITVSTRTNYMDDDNLKVGNLAKTIVHGADTTGFKRRFGHADGTNRTVAGYWQQIRAPAH